MGYANIIYKLWACPINLFNDTSVSNLSRESNHLKIIV